MNSLCTFVFGNYIIMDAFLLALIILCFVLIVVVFLYILSKIKKIDETQEALKNKLDEIDTLVYEMIDVAKLISENTTTLTKTVSDKALKSLMDLQEFRDLDNDLKAKYHKYVTNKIMVAINNKLNKESDKYDEQFMKTTSDMIVKSVQDA